MTSPSSAEPPSKIALAYFGLAHAALALAAAIMTWAPLSLAGFFYRPRVISAVHLVTLGWISSSILGALYMIAPMALRTRLAVGAADWLAFALYGVGVSGMVSHFWIHQPVGMLWSAGMVVLGFAWVGAKTLRAVLAAPIELASRLAITLAFLNLALAATIGGYIGWAQAYPRTGGIDLSTVTAHVLMATVGWALMMVVGAGYRLLPMLLPSALAPRLPSLASVALIEAGLLALAAGLLAHWHQQTIAVACVVLGTLLFLVNVAWMRLHPRPRARSLPRWDLGRLQIFEALLYLVLSLGLGAWLAPAARSAEALYRWMPVLVAFLLVGFLAQMISGVGARLFPLYLWMRSFKESSAPPLPPPPGKVPSTTLAGLVLLAWTVAVPVLVYGLARRQPSEIRMAGIVLLLATTASSLQIITMSRRIAAARRV